MAIHVKQIPFPDFLLKTDCTIEIESEGISEVGEPIIDAVIESRCIFSEKTKRIIDPNGTRVDLLGKVILKGDICPNISKVKSGKIFIAGKEMNIYSCSRPRNPDGSIYSTNFEVM